MKQDGLVISKVINKGTKSERTAVLLNTGEKTLVLRRKNGNPFSDNALDNLVGKTIRATGKVLEPNIFLMDSWAVIK